jgi:hypothetical protein
MSPGERLSGTDTGSEAGASPRRPYWVVGLTLLGAIVLVLVGAVLLDRQFRPPVGREPTGGTQAVARSTTAPMTSVPPTAAASSTLPAATPATAASRAAPALRVASSPLEREIEAAYLRYWDVLRQAYLNLDGSKLSEVSAGAELARQEQEIRDLKAQGRAAKLDIEHRLTFVEVSSERAILYDEYQNGSVFVDPATKQELPTKQPPETERISFEMRRVDGTWRVVDGARHE